MTGDFTTLFKAFLKWKSPSNSRYSVWWSQHLTAQEKFFEILDAFDGPFHIIEQSISGDVKATYKKIKPFIKWMYVNIENQINLDQDYEDYEWSTYG